MFDVFAFGNNFFLPLDLTEPYGDLQCIDMWRDRTDKPPRCPDFESFRFVSFDRIFNEAVKQCYLFSTALPGPVFRALILEDLKVLSDVDDKVFGLVQIFGTQCVVLDELDVVVLRYVSLPIVSAKHL